MRTCTRGAPRGKHPPLSPLGGRGRPQQGLGAIVLGIGAIAVRGWRVGRDGEDTREHLRNRRALRPATQECKTDLGKQVSLHGICITFPKFRFFCRENVDLRTFQNNRILLFLLWATLPCTLAWCDLISKHLRFINSVPGNILHSTTFLSLVGVEVLQIRLKSETPPAHRVGSGLRFQST